MPLTREMLDLNPGLPCSRMGVGRFPVFGPLFPSLQPEALPAFSMGRQTVAQVEPGLSASIDRCRRCYLEVPRGFWEVASSQRRSGGEMGTEPPLSLQEPQKLEGTWWGRAPCSHGGRVDPSMCRFAE